MSNLTYIKVIKEVNYYTIQEPDPNDSWDRGESGENHYIRGIQIVSEKDYHDLVVNFPIQKNETYFLVLVNYNTGNSFGRTNGKVEFIDLFKTEGKARQLAEKIAEDQRHKNDQDYNHSFSYSREDGTTAQCGTYTWTGYFERFNYSEVETVSVTSNSEKRFK